MKRIMHVWVAALLLSVSVPAVQPVLHQARVADAVVQALTVTPAAAQTVDQVTDYGYRGFEGNELTVGSKVDDPAKYRCSSPITEHGGGGCVLSFNFHRAIGEVAFGGRQTELAMLRVEQAEDRRGTFDPKAEFNFLCNDGSSGGDAAMQKCLSFTWTGITRMSPWILRDLRQLIGGGGVGASGGTSRMESPGGQYWLQLQSDGNYVIYDTFVFNEDGSMKPTAYFDLWSLMARLDRIDAELRALYNRR